MVHPRSGVRPLVSPALLVLVLCCWSAPLSRTATLAEYRRPSGGRQDCGTVLEEGSALVTWRRHSPSTTVRSQRSDICQVQHINNTHIHRCMELKHGRKAALFNAYFVGDSRMRDLYARFSAHTGADREQGRAKDNCLEWIQRTYAPGEAPHGRDHWCSYHRHGDHVTLTYLSRNLVDSRYMESVQRLERTCPGPECADLLLVNGGMHALWHNVGNYSIRGVQQFGRQMTELAPALQRLSEKGVQTEVAWLMNQVALAVLRRFSGVKIWSSHLPVAVWYQEVCRALDFPTTDGFNCKDAIHLDDFAYDNYIDILMNFLCDDLIEMPESNCCGLDSR